MNWALELIVVPVADVDGAKEFYVDRLGWDLIVDHQPTEDFRVVQVVPPGSGCAIAIMRNVEAAGSLQGLHLVVADIGRAQAQLRASGVETSDLFHFVDGVQTPGADPGGADYNSFFSFADPEGTGWLVQEVTSRGA